MKKEKLMSLVLLDLCTFVLTRSGCEEAIQNFEFACSFAEKYSLPELKTYREFIKSLERSEIAGLN